jgi:hypothetical protein
MALRAIMGEIGADVIRIHGGGVILRVAGVAVRRQADVLTAAVAVLAREIHMGSCKGKRRFVMIKNGSKPRTAVMAQCAVPGKSRGSVVRIGCCVVVLKMTPDAVRRSPLKFKVHMTLAALQQGVRSFENKPGECPVIE